MPTNKPRVTFTIDETQLNKIDKYRFEYKFKNQTQAILSLIESGLDVIQKQHRPSQEFSKEEMEQFKKYRALDKHGKETVDFILEREWTRSTTPKETVTVFSIPYAYDLAASAGTGEYAMDIAHFENVGITQKPPKGANFLIRVSGNSMEPEYFDNDKVFVKRMDDVDDGEIGLFFLDGDVYIKEKNANGLRSLNPDYQIIPVNEYSSIKCYGKIIGKCDCDITEI